MTAAARRSAKEIDPISREIAQTLARQSGMSLADWIASLMGGEAAPAASLSSEVERATEGPLERDDSLGRHSPGRLEAPPHPADAAGELISAVKSLTDRLEAIETRPSVAGPSVDETVRAAISRLVEAGREQVAVAARFEGAVAEIGGEQARIADRLRRLEAEKAGSRSTEALRALEGTLGKMAGHLYEGEGRTREAIEEISAKLKRVEAGQSAAPSQVADSIAGLAQSLGEAETRTGKAMGELRDTLGAIDARLESVEVAGLGAASAERLEEAEARTSATLRGIGESLAALDARLDGVQDAARTMAPAARLDEVEAHVAQALGSLDARLEGVQATVSAAVTTEQLDEIQARAEEALAALDSRIGDIEAQASASASTERLEQVESRAAIAFRALGQSLGAVDERLGRAEKGLSEAATRESLAEVTRDLLDRIDTSRAETGERLAELDEQVQGAEHRSQEAVGKIGRDVIDLSASLVARVQGAEHRTSEAIEQMGGEVARLANSVEDRFGHVDSLQAHALEKLGDEIARISERLAERIATADRNSAQAIEEVGDQMARVTERLSQRQERTSEDLAERIRLGEERTTRVLKETRDEIERMSQARRRAADLAGSGSLEAEQEPLFGDDPFAGFSPASPPQVLAAPVFSQEDLDLADSFPDVDEPAAAQAPEATQEAEAAKPPAPMEPGEFETLMSAGFDTPAAPPAAAAGESVLAADEPRQIFPPPAAPLSTREAVEKARISAQAAAGPARTTSKPTSRGSLFGAGAAARGGMFPRRSFADAAHRSNGGAAALGLGLAAAIGLALGGFWFIQSEPAGSLPNELAALLPLAAPPRDATAPAPPGAVAGRPQMALALAPGGAGPGAHSFATPTEDLPGVYAGAVSRLAANDAHGLDDLRRIAGLGYAPAQFYLAKLYETGGYGVTKDPVLARTWTARAAQAGDARAMHNLALDYYEGTGGTRSISEAGQWFAKAAALGLSDSQYNLGLLYEEGRGVPQNLAEAYKWYLIAARSGDTDSRANADRVKAELTPEARAAAERSAAAFRPAQPAAALAAIPPTTAPSAVARAQKALAGLGYYQGPSDGAGSPALRMALSAYQRDQGLPVTGAPDPATVTKLESQ